MTWTFPGARNGQTKGLNDSGVETFSGNKIGSLAREICQNSLDAKHPRGADGGVPVEVEFRIFETEREEFPQLAELRDALLRMEAFWEKKCNEQALEFLAKVRAALAKRKMRWLRISDFGTTGLTGVSDDDPDASNAWLNLVKSSGVSQKTDASGGSFGIGKFAAFSCSQVRTVFYATKTVDGEEGFQGVAHLLSYRDADGNLTFGTGYYGLADAMHAREWRNFDGGFVRDRPGTDIYVPLFLGDGENFIKEIQDDVLDGFMYAIWKNRLKVVIDAGGERVVIDSAYLEELEQQDAFPNAHLKFKYDVMKMPAAEWRRESIGNGSVRLGIKIGPGRKSKIAMIREPGMQIFQKDKLNSSLSFTGVLIVEGDLNQQLKKFENPQHTKWEAKRDSEHRGLLREVYDFCKSALREISQVNEGEQIDSGLGDILPDMGDDERRETEVLSVKARSVGKTERRKPKRTKSERGQGAPKTPHNGGKTTKGDGDKPNVGSQGGDGEEPVKRERVEWVKFRPICRDRGQGAYTLKVVPGRDAAEGEIVVKAVAEIGEYPAPLLGAKTTEGAELAVRGEVIAGVAFRKGEALSVDVTLDSKDYLTLEVELNELKR